MSERGLGFNFWVDQIKRKVAIILQN